jgi:hypothetical protein
MSERKEPQGPGKQIVGYGKPPVHKRFRKGQSGNPGGRPRGPTLGRSAALAQKEIYRSVKVSEGDTFKSMPALEVVYRKMVALAIKGNAPAMRLVIEISQTLDREIAAQAAAHEAAQPANPKASEADTVRRIAFLFAKVGQQKEEERQEKEHQEKERREQQR